LKLREILKASFDEESTDGVGVGLDGLLEEGAPLAAEL